MNNQKPDYEDYLKGVKLSIWHNTNSPRMVINRRIKKTGADKYSHLDYFRPDDIPSILELIERAQDYLISMNLMKMNEAPDISL